MKNIFLFALGLFLLLSCNNNNLQQKLEGTLIPNKYAKGFQAFDFEEFKIL